MCGRYAASRSPDDLVEEFDVQRVDVAEPLPPDYNVAPTKPVYAVLARPPRDEQGRRVEDAEPQRRLSVLRWGLVPSWAKNASVGSRLVNARMETVHEKPAFRRAFAARRCLLPADGYFEWYGERKGAKQPFFIRPHDGGILAMAGLYEIWRDPQRPDDDPDPLLWTCTVLTTSAEDEVGRIHDRMPLLVEEQRWQSWLDPRTGDDPDALRSLLVPAAPGRLEAYPVSTEVNDVRNNGPQLVAPVQPEGPTGEDPMF